MTTKLKLSAIGLGLGLALYGSSAFAAGTVDVSLWDHPGTTMTMNMGLGMGGDHTLAAMGITATPTSVTAGDVTFNVKNDSTTMIHEMVVIPIANAETAPTFDATTMEVNEDAAGAIGEVAELQPGTTGTVTLNLPAGTYILICNVPGHYAAGMWTILTVAP